MALHDQQLPHEGPRQACLVSSRRKKIVKVCWGGGVLVVEALECRVVRLPAAGNGLAWLKFPKGSSNFSCIAGVSCKYSFIPCYVAGVVEVSRRSCSFVLCCGSGASCSPRTGAHQEAPEATAQPQPLHALAGADKEQSKEGPLWVIRGGVLGKEQMARRTSLQLIQLLGELYGDL
ncbi:hypothetical protein L345_02138, partial [Ophiophagus hannah]